MACLELRRECKEENIEYCLELFFDEMKESAYQELYPEVFDSFAEAIQADQNPGLSSSGKVESTINSCKTWDALPRSKNSPVISVGKGSNTMSSGSSFGAKNMKDDKLSKLEKRFTDKPSLTGSPFKNRILPNTLSGNNSTAFQQQQQQRGHPLTLVAANYTSFLAQLTGTLQKYPPIQEKFLLEFLLVVDSYQFIRNAYFILFEKFTRLHDKYARLFSAAAGKGAKDLDSMIEEEEDDEATLVKMRKKYLELVLCVRIWGFLAALEAYNEDKFILESNKEIATAAFLKAELFLEKLQISCIDGGGGGDEWLPWAIIDSFLTFSGPFLPLTMKQKLRHKIVEKCPLKPLYQSIKEKLIIQTAADSMMVDSESWCPPKKGLLLEDSILEMIQKVNQLQIIENAETKECGAEKSENLNFGSALTRRTIKPVPVAFVPVKNYIYFKVHFGFKYFLGFGGYASAKGFERLVLETESQDKIIA